VLWLGKGGRVGGGPVSGGADDGIRPGSSDSGRSVEVVLSKTACVARGGWRK